MARVKELACWGVVWKLKLPVEKGSMLFSNDNSCPTKLRGKLLPDKVIAIYFGIHNSLETQVENFGLTKRENLDHVYLTDHDLVLNSEEWHSFWEEHMRGRYKIEGNINENKLHWYKNKAAYTNQKNWGMLWTAKQSYTFKELGLNPFHPDFAWLPYRLVQESRLAAELTFRFVSQASKKTYVYWVEEDLLLDLNTYIKFANILQTARYKAIDF